MTETPSDPLRDQVSPDLSKLAHHGLLRPWLERVVTAGALENTPMDEGSLRDLLGQFCERHRIQDDAELQQFLAGQLLTLNDLLWQLSLPQRIQRHAERQFAPRAEQHFLTRKTELDQVVYSLLRVQDAGLARELYLRIDSGEANFADLADRYAEGPERASRGIIGPVSLTQAHPALAEKLRTQPVGKLMQPFQIEQWWLVVRTERMIAASFDNAMAERMANELFEGWVSEEVDRMLRQLAAGSADLAA